MAQRKAVTWNYDDIVSTDNAVLRAHLLTERDVQIFAAVVQQLEWRTRWTGAISTSRWDTLQAELAQAMDRLMIPVDFCKLVADCISSSDDVRGALANYGIATATPQSTASTGTNLLENVPCDSDTLYGACVAIVDFANDLCVDFLERVENDTTFVATVARIIDMLPVIGDLPILDDLNDVVAWISENGITLYESGYTVVLRQAVICNMFCLAQADCDLTVEDVLAAFAAELSIVVAITEPLELLIRALVQTIADTDFALAFNLLILSVLASGGEALGFVGLPSLSSLARTSDPDPDWQVLCAPCPQTFEHTFDFTLGAEGWTVVQGQATANGIETTQSSTTGTRSIIRITFDQRDITQVIYTGHSNGWSSSVDNAQAFSIRIENTEVFETDGKDMETGDIERDWTGSIMAGEMQLYLRTALTDAGQLAYHISFTVRGNGTNPFL